MKFGDVIEGKTVQERVDEVTGLSRKVIIEFTDADLRPRISIKDKEGKTAKAGSAGGTARYLLSVGVNIGVNEGDRVEAGDIIAKIPRETTKTKDITGGLPRVAELFEARKPKEFAVISEIDGVVTFGKDVKGRRRVIVTPDVGDKKEYLIPKGKHITVQEGDRIAAGEALMDGASNPHDLLMIKGEKELARYLVDEVQEVYRLQGVKINDKHIEIIVRQMLRRVRIADSGDTTFLADEQVEKRPLPGGERPGHGEGRQARHRRAHPAGDHEGVSLDAKLHLGGLLPGNDPGPHRGGAGRQDRLSASESKRMSSWAVSSRPAPGFRCTGGSAWWSRADG